MKLFCAMLASTALAACPATAQGLEAVTLAAKAEESSGPRAQAEADPAQPAAPRASAEPSGSRPENTQAKKEQSAFDRLWSAARLHQDDDHSVLNELRLVGRFHVDQYFVQADQGDDSDLLVRRARIGARARLFRNLEAHVEAELDLEGGPLYSRLTDAYLAWKFSDAARVTVGKQSVKFTADGGTSSNELLTIDRSNVANNFWFTDEYIPGVGLSGRSGKWSYNTGLYTGGREDREFGDFGGGYFWLGSIGRDYSAELGVKRAVVRLDYVYNKPDADSDFTRPFKHIGALVAVLDAGRWGLTGELVAGEGFLGQSDAVGASATPWFNITKRLQLAGRFTLVNSRRLNGVRLGRYENVVTGGRGDLYQEVYGGLNYFLYGHKLKLQTGITLADMRDRARDGGAYQGWTWTSALRASW